MNIALALLVASVRLGLQGPGGIAYAFAGDSLEIAIAARAPLRVEIEDGRAGQVRVEDLTRSGAAAYSLAPTQLSLVHDAPSAAVYRVEVPPTVRVTLRVNEVPVATLGVGAQARRLVWSSGPAVAAPVAEVAAPAEAAEPALEFRVQAFAGPLVVDSIDVAYPERARLLRIRLGRRDFRVSGDRALGFGYHAPTRWGVLTVRDTAARVEVEVPAEAGRFTVRVDGRPIWRLDSAGARALCQPVARVRRKDGGEDWVFHLESGLDCREEEAPPKLRSQARTARAPRPPSEHGGRGGGDQPTEEGLSTLDAAGQLERVVAPALV